MIGDEFKKIMQSNKDCTVIMADFDGDVGNIEKIIKGLVA